MPYIDTKSRLRIEYCAKEKNAIKLLSDAIQTEGDLNYIITRLCHEFIVKVGKKYATLNTIIGVLECAKQEFYRRIISPYENKKIDENGDVK